MENEQNINLALKKLYEESESRVKTDAIVSRAYTDKISKETIDEKVEAQMNAIKVGVHEINPRFKEGSKNFDTTKNSIIKVMAEYEQALKELSEFYDGKIEQLILRKVELEANLVGTLINEEYLHQNLEKEKKQKDKDEVKTIISSTLKKVFERLTHKKKEKSEIDVRLLHNMQDAKDLETEITVDLSNKVQKTEQEQKENKEFLEKVEKEIRLIDEEIKRINERKKQSLYEAMEIGDKYLAVTIKKPKMFKKITRFFVSRFNTAKVVENTIIEPLNQRIENFKNNELSNMKG